MSRSVIGIDPGNEGALAFLDEESVILEPMPLRPDGKPDLVELSRLLAHYAPQATRVYLEVPGIRPRQSPQTTAPQWRTFGRIEGVLAVLRAPVFLIRPEVWSKEYSHGVTEKDKHKRYQAIKKARREIAAKLYPGIDLRKNDKSAVPHGGIVDALLLADYGMRQLRGTA